MKSRKIIRNPNYKFLSALPLIGIGVFLPQQSGKAMIRRFATSTISNTAKFFYGSNGVRIPINKPSTIIPSRVTTTSTIPNSNTANKYFYGNGTKYPLFSSTANSHKNAQIIQKVSLPKTSKPSSDYTPTSTIFSHPASSSTSNNHESVQTLPKVTLTKTNKTSIDHLDTPKVSSNVSVSKSNLESKTKLAPLLSMNQSYYKLYFEDDDTNTTSNNVVNTHNQSAKNMTSGNNQLNNSLDSNKNNENLSLIQDIKSKNSQDKAMEFFILSHFKSNLNGKYKNITFTYQGKSIDNWLSSHLKSIDSKKE